jgi:hypothetical protein
MKKIEITRAGMGEKCPCPKFSKLLAKGYIMCHRCKHYAEIISETEIMCNYNSSIIMSELEKILNDDLLKCEIVESAENAARRVDLIKWTHDNTFSVAEVNKDTGKLEVTDVPGTDELEAYKHFYRKCGDIAIIS